MVAYVRTVKTASGAIAVAEVSRLLELLQSSIRVRLASSNWLIKTLLAALSLSL